MAGPVKGAGRITRLALLTAIALTIFMAEAQLPVIPVPGVKLGLANIVTVYVIFAMGPWDALLVLSARELRTIPIAIDSLMGQYIMQWDLALPALMMAILPALIAFLFMQKNIVDGLTAGAVKS